jgi:predicted DNA-binding transcriptional regulator YafY
VQAPVVAGAPVVRQLLKMRERHAALPAGVGQLIRPARTTEALTEIVEVGVRHIDAERAEVGHSPDRTGPMRHDRFRNSRETVAVSETAARLLRLLGLLQSRPGWTGRELADRLAVTPRTVRKDVERLRDLGYAVHARPGRSGGYRLGVPTAVPPLLLDDEEAVALAVGMRTAPDGTVRGLEEVSLRALAKLEQVLPSHLRRRAAALSSYTEPAGRGGPSIDPDLLVTMVGACRDREGLRFRYRGHDGNESRRAVEPHRLVHLGRFWYLAAWDLERDGWRTFRLDRITGAPSPAARFAPRAPPEGGFVAFVSRGRSTARDRHRATVRLHAPLAVAAQRVTPSSGTLEAINEQTCLLHTGGPWLGAVSVHIAMVDLDFDVVSPPELAHVIHRLAERFARARFVAR